MKDDKKAKKAALKNIREMALKSSLGSRVETKEPPSALMIRIGLAKPPDADEEE